MLGFEHGQAVRGCAGVVCNSGFELISECLQLGKTVLTRPVLGQMEQMSNAFALAIAPRISLPRVAYSSNT